MKSKCAEEKAAAVKSAVKKCKAENPTADQGNATEEVTKAKKEADAAMKAAKTCVAEKNAAI